MSLRLYLSIKYVLMCTYQILLCRRTPIQVLIKMPSNNPVNSVFISRTIYIYISVRINIYESITRAIKLISANAMTTRYDDNLISMSFDIQCHFLFLSLLSNAFLCINFQLQETIFSVLFDSCVTDCITYTYYIYRYSIA